MDCKEAEKLIQPYVQGNMPEKEMEPFISHIRKCHTCHEELETYFIVNRAMAYFEDDAPDSYNLTGLLERDLEKKEGRSETPPVQRYVFPGADADSRSVSGAPVSALF